MSDIPEWQSGDLALCIRTGRYLHAGQVLTVEAVTPADDLWSDGRFGVGLILAGVRHPANMPTGEFWHGHFRKVTPPKADEFDREVIELMNSKPEKVS